MPTKPRYKKGTSLTVAARMGLLELPILTWKGSLCCHGPYDPRTRSFVQEDTATASDGCLSAFTLSTIGAQ